MPLEAKERRTLQTICLKDAVKSRTAELAGDNDAYSFAAANLTGLEKIRQFLTKEDLGDFQMDSQQADELFSNSLAKEEKGKHVVDSSRVEQVKQGILLRVNVRQQRQIMEKLGIK